MISTNRRRGVVLALTLLALAYSSLHFIASGVRYPLSVPNLGQIEEEIAPLREHLRTGDPVRVENRRQYGPTLFFVVHPILWATGDDSVALERWLYAIQLIAVLGSFLLTWATLQRWVPGVAAGSSPLIVAWLAVIWLNFTPMYTILTVKNVETWELLAITLALYAYLRGWAWITGVALAAGALTKLVPFVFMYYLLLRNRRVFACACAAVLALLLVSHLTYGPQMGLRYLPERASATLGASTTWALDWHENISLKGIIVKLFGRLDKADRDGYFVVLTERQRAVAVLLGTVAQAVGGLWLTWVILRRRGPVDAGRVVWEWSLFAVALLILSPSTAFEYTTLALGAVSYAFVRLIVAPDGLSVAVFAAAVLLLGAVVPRSVLNEVTAVEFINQWTGYTHLTPSEAYQYYGFPLIALALLLIVVCRVGPDLTPQPLTPATRPTARVLDKAT